jgi:Leucine-rich repeat (LRR) protein
MSAINKLGTALAISTLTLAMFGCKGQSNSVSAPQTVTSASISSTSQNSVKLTPIETLSISDYSLDLCIKNTGREYLEEITTLVCNNKGIQYLEGIEALTQLKSLYLSFNEINDITPLVGLKNLKTLYLSGNQISNLDALSELTELTELGIQKNNVQDLSPLQSLSMLKSLHTHSNQIQDFTILGSLELNELSGKKRQES